MTKTRNRLDKDKVQKMVFVRRFLKLKRSVCMDESDAGFSGWVELLLKDASGSSDGVGSSSGDEKTQKKFMDVIETGEQGKINGREPGRPAVGLTELKKDNAAKSWLFEKYYDMCFVDKNPEGDELAPPLADKSKWEHRIIKDVVWWRSYGYTVETHLQGGVANQSVKKYQINRSLLRMIRESPNNKCAMFTKEGSNDDDDSDGDGSDDNNSSRSLDLDHGRDSTDLSADESSSSSSSDDIPLSAVFTDIRKNNKSN